MSIDVIKRELAKEKRKYLKVYDIPEHVDVDERFPRSTIECYTLQRVKKYASLVTSDVLFYVCFTELRKLENKNGSGACYGRTEWGPFCLLHCYDYRIMNVRVLSDKEQEAIRKSIYEEDD